jgi:hypothetical protein
MCGTNAGDVLFELDHISDKAFFVDKVGATCVACNLSLPNPMEPAATCNV